jgi:hypothetical protein
MVDVHIIHLPERDEWLGSCLSSMDRQPVNIFVLPPADPTKFGSARADGYRLGSSDYVVQVGDDDLVLPLAFDKILESFRQHPLADFVQTQWHSIYKDRIITGIDLCLDSQVIRMADTRFPLCENLFVYKRCVINKFIDILSTLGKDADLGLQMIVKKSSRGYFLRDHLYLWRNHENGLHHL